MNLSELQAEQGQLVVGPRVLVPEAGASDRGERFGDVFTALTDIGQLVSDLYARRSIKLIAAQDRIFVGVPDLNDTDWIVLAECGHVSPWFVDYADAFDWSCEVCEDRRRQESSARDLLHRLRHVASVHQRRSGDATGMSSQS